MDGLADAFKVLVHSIVGEAQHLQTILAQDGGPLCIVLLALVGVVLPAVYFDHQLCLGTVEVHDKALDDALFVELYWVVPKKTKPQFVLLGCHIAPQFPCTRQHGELFGNNIRFHKRTPSSQLGDEPSQSLRASSPERGSPWQRQNVFGM